LFSFSKRKQIVDAAPRMRKIIDLTCPNSPQANEVRGSRRYNRVVPVAISDWTPEGADLNNMGFGFTTDISESGFGILTRFFPKTLDNVIGFYLPKRMDEPFYFRVSYSGYRREPQNYLRIGYSVVEFLNETYSQQVTKITPKLIELMSVDGSTQ